MIIIHQEQTHRCILKPVNGGFTLGHVNKKHGRIKSEGRHSREGKKYHGRRILCNNRTFLTVRISIQLDDTALGVFGIPNVDNSPWSSWRSWVDQTCFVSNMNMICVWIFLATKEPAWAKGMKIQHKKKNSTYPSDMDERFVEGCRS